MEDSGLCVRSYPCITTESAQLISLKLGTVSMY
jgi:hypothetical protein